ncbi:hypothetical protein BASA81_010299 [Batrachochytrium salamandrivorans]|nr:hypothetical protein BASA81_010299 [Batrachochytrium salamandrivorans]
MQSVFASLAFSPLLAIKPPTRRLSDDDDGNEELVLALRMTKSFDCPSLSSYPKQDLQRPSSSIARERQEFELFCGFVAKESNKYEFAHTMQTDGIACSLLRNEKGAGAEKKKRLARKRELLALPKDLKRVRPEPSAKRAELYVAPTGSSERVVGVDPGKSDLISSGTGPGDWFRYTQKRHETGEKKHRRARTKMARTLVEGKTVVEWELSTFSRKALTVSAAEAWGDWSRGSQMKFLEPTKGVGMRKLFSRAGYEVVLVDEFRTSCTCFGCEGGACEKFRSVMNPRRWMREKRPMVLRNGLLSCQNCKRLWNRDRNGSLNIMRCAQAARLGGQRPSYMTRNFSEARSAVTTQGAGLPTMAVFI